LDPFPFCSEPNLAIPDNDAAGVWDSHRITADRNVLDLDVAITITHPWVGDLVISLEHIETGRRVLLYDRPGVPESLIGCSGGDLRLTLDDDAELTVEDNCQPAIPAYPLGGTFSPNEPLSNFSDIPLSGTWELHVTDLAFSDIGTLNRWCLEPTLQAAPELAFAHTSFNARNAPALAPITVTLDRPAALTVTVDFASIGGSAVAGIHYITTTGTLTFTPGITDESFTVPVTTMPLSTTQTVTLALSHPANANLSQPDETILRLLVLPYRLYLPVYLVPSTS
jgi:subtilisin-like proprotein convertase family protein